MAKVYTLSEVAKHNTSSDCWIIVFGKVYDVTPFLEDHPGGDEILVNATGKDASPDFDDVGHSHEAWVKMEKLYIGEVDKATLERKAVPAKLELDPNRNKQSTTRKLVTLFIQFLVPLILFNLAVNFFSKASA